jgi:hypothetical protein
MNASACQLRAHEHGSKPSKRKPNSGCRLGHVKSRPAPVFFVSSGALLAGVVEQPLRDVLPDRVAAIQSDSIGGLDFHGPLAAAAGDAQHVALNFRKTSQRYLVPGRTGTRVFEDRFPVFGREGCIRSRSGGARPTGSFSGQLFHLYWGRHAPARGSVGHPQLELLTPAQKNHPVGRVAMSEPSRAERLESSISIGVPPSWPPALTGKASCAFSSSPVR